MPDLLLELGTEELPARFIGRALKALEDQVRKGLAAAHLPAAEIKSGGTPRRLAVWAGGLAERQPDISEEKKGPAKQAAQKDGEWTDIAKKWAASFGVELSALTFKEITKGKTTREYLWAEKTVVGRPALEVLAELIPQWIEGIPFAKSMRWVEGSKVRFGRPLRRITALLGDPSTGGSEVIPAQWADVKASRRVEGHRFLHDELISLSTTSWEEYVRTLLAQHVVVDRDERRQRVVDGLRPHLGDDGLARYGRLVDEVIDLVEWPDVEVGNFASHLLEVPEIVIREAMTGHQRYFPITENGKLAPRFAFVANRPMHKVIQQGNERVLNARLKDALFFFQLDQKTPLDQRVDDLESIVFMQEVGTLKDRIPRVKALALEVAKAAGWAPEDAEAPASGMKITRSKSATVLHVHLAAELGRADKNTEVVGEFPELQGEIGAIYARMQGQPDEVAEAIRESYLPRGEGDDLPETKVGICMAIADKLDTTACAWATGKKPTGSGDLYQVRRCVLGILRILREREVDIGTRRLIEAAVAVLPEAKGVTTTNVARDVYEFFETRLEQLAKSEGRDVHLTRKVSRSGKDPSNVVGFWLRLDALGELAQDERFKPLCELVERTKTITEKNGADVDPGDVDVSRLEHPAEKALYEAIQGCRDAIRTAIDERRYVDAGKAYVDALAEVTHTFFEPAPVGVFVMDEDARLRTNRLALLKQVHALLADGFADLAAKEEARGKKGKKKGKKK